jgi:hypothetical protein
MVSPQIPLIAQYVLTEDGLIYMSNICCRLKFNVYHITKRKFGKLRCLWSYSCE